MHVVVAWYQDGARQPRRAASGSSRRPSGGSRRYAPAHRGVDVASLLAQVAAGRPGALAPLDLAEADEVEHTPQTGVEPPLAVEEEQQPERDEDEARSRHVARSSGRASKRKPPIARANATPTSRNAPASPSEYAVRSRIPFATVPVALASTSTEPRTAPTHGAAHTANAAPSSAFEPSARARDKTRREHSLRPRQQPREREPEDDEQKPGELDPPLRRQHRPERRGAGAEQ